MKVSFAASTDVGRQRDHNEDNFLVDRRLNLFIVADGMGGHAAGEVASRVAVHKVREVLKRNEDLVAQFREEGGPLRREILSLFEHAVQESCSHIYEMARQDESKRGMGTTLSALLILGSRGFIAHVGDSRIYLYRQHHVHQLTEDHTLIQELIRRGRLRPEEAERAPYKNAVTRAVGVYESVEVDTFDFDVLGNDAYILCSDGLHGYLKDHEIPPIIGDDDPEKVPQLFIDLANERGGKDNITCLLVRVSEEEEEEDRKPLVPTEDVTLQLETLKSIPLLQYLNYKEVIRVANITEPRTYAAGDTIIEEGDVGDELFVILDGQVRVSKGDQTITNLTRGGHFGEMALVDRSARSATVTAETATSVLALRRDRFYQIVKNETALAVKLLWSFVQVLTERLRATSSELRDVQVERQDQRPGAESPAADQQRNRSIDVLFSDGDR